MNLQVIASPDGEIVWVSGPLPGAAHDLTAARIWGIVRELAAAGLIVLADKGYTGAGDPSAPPRRAGTSRPRRRRPTAPTRSYAAPASAPTPGRRPGASCANSAAARGRPGSSPRPSTSFKPARCKDEWLTGGLRHTSDTQRQAHGHRHRERGRSLPPCGCPEPTPNRSLVPSGTATTVEFLAGVSPRSAPGVMTPRRAALAPARWSGERPYPGHVPGHCQV
jgi:DDE superfamily endonuclease